MKFETNSLEESFFLELSNPCLSPTLTEIVLVVLVEDAAEELAIPLGLALNVVVALGGGLSEQLAAGSLELVVKLSDGVAVVVGVTLLVANSEDGNLLSVHGEVGKLLVQPLVPGGAAPLAVGSSVPRGGAGNDGVESVNFFGVSNFSELGSIDSGGGEGLNDVPTAGLAVSGHGAVEHASLKRGESKATAGEQRAGGGDRGLVGAFGETQRAKKQRGNTIHAQQAPI